MYGCNNFCTYCIVPYVRGRERSRHPKDILEEVEVLAKQGYKYALLWGKDTPILYKRDRFELIDSDFLIYPLSMPDFAGEFNNGKTKSLCIAALRDKTDGKKLIFMTTHLWWKKSDPSHKNYQLGSDEYTAAFEMADEGDFTRNHEYIVYAYFKKSGLTLTVKAMPWDLQTITNEFSNTVSLAEGGMLKWTDGTYFSKGDDTKELILKPDINYPAEFTFNLASPRGCVWHAVLRTKGGNPDAF